MTFIPNRKFKRDYDRIYKKDPVAANVFLLMCELADEHGQVKFTEPAEVEIQRLLMARFDDLRAYQLPGGLKG
jgi:hypothetical protein